MIAKRFRQLRKLTALATGAVFCLTAPLAAWSEPSFLAPRSLFDRDSERQNLALADVAAASVLAGYESYWEDFKTITARSKSRFEHRDWQGVLRDAEERIESYERHLDGKVEEMKGALGNRVTDQELWKAIKGKFIGSVLSRYDADLAQNYFSSVRRRVFSTEEAVFQYVDEGLKMPRETRVRKRVDTAYAAREITPDLVGKILTAAGFSVAFEDLERDARVAADEINDQLARVLSSRNMEAVAAYLQEMPPR